MKLIVWLLTTLPLPALLVTIIGTFVLLLSLLLIVAFIPGASDNIAHLLDVLQSRPYPRSRRSRYHTHRSRENRG